MPKPGLLNQNYHTNAIKSIKNGSVIVRKTIEYGIENFKNRNRKSGIINSLMLNPARIKTALSSVNQHKNDLYNKLQIMFESSPI